MHYLQRTEKLLGKPAVERLRGAKVAVFGLGGVGSYAAEALARSGVGTLVLIDSDVIDVTNINRQLYALHSTIGRPKVEVARERIADIDPACRVETYQMLFMPESDVGLLEGCDWIVDAIDTVTAKLFLAQYAREHGVGLVSAMGTGNKTDPTRLRIDDIKNTSVCPLCRVMRRELKARGIDKLTVVWSDQPPIITGDTPEERRTPASCAFVPSVAGLLLAAHVVNTIIAEGSDQEKK